MLINGKGKAYEANLQSSSFKMDRLVNNSRKML